jgi:hypothetical protein
VIVNLRLMPDVIEGQEVLVTAQIRGQETAINQQITSILLSTSFPKKDQRAA